MILLKGSVVTILEELELTPGTNDKIKLLEFWKEWGALQTFLNIALNPYRIYHIKKLPTKPFNKYSLNQATLKNVYSLDDLAQYLESKRGLCKEDLDVVYYYFEGLHSDLERKWATKALLKKTIAGVGAKTVNKAFGYKFLPEYKIMLMSEWKDSLHALNYPVYVQRKLDGFRCTYIPNIGFLGRNGKPIANANLSNHFNMGNVISIKGNICNSLNSVFDGEAYSSIRNFNEIASILSSTNKLIPNDFKFHIFNVIPIKEWNAEISSGTYMDQFTLFLTLQHANIGPNIKFIQTYLCKNPEDLNKYYQRFLEEGYEGAIVRDPSFSYCWKRATAKSQTVFKLKPHDHIDAMIVGIYEWEGDYQEYFQRAIDYGFYTQDDFPKVMLGGFNIELENGTKLKVGGGFSEKERLEFWVEGEKLIGEWVRIKYTEYTPDGSLRFPVFDSLRDAKE